MTHPGRPWRVVIDPNVFVAALIAPGGVCGDLVDAVNEDRLTAVACPLLLAELHEVLLRPKFRRWTSIEGVLAFGRAVAARCEIEAEPEEAPPRTRQARPGPLT
jgi:putative PIN family toxin of toxin-antitoxin system